MQSLASKFESRLNFAFLSPHEVHTEYFWEQSFVKVVVHVIKNNQRIVQVAKKRNIVVRSNNFVACLPCLGANIKILEDQLDELIVETATKRKQWPKKILVHAIQTMKAEQEMLKLYQPVVTPEEIKSQPSQGNDFSGEGSTLIERAEGFSQALTWQPILELCKLRQEVFTGCNAKEENSVQNFVSPAEVTPTDADTTNNPYTLFKRKKAADTPQRRYYPLRRRKITLSM
uniref:NSL1 component of MIS12 kinetochore complex n=1 Tax=Meleagris gallopavo TaxID=9103 RepID=G3UQI5_MELGA